MSTAIERISIDAPYGSDVVADARPAIGWVTRSEADGWRQARAEADFAGLLPHLAEVLNLQRSLEEAAQERVLT